MANGNNEGFSYTYSAREQSEIKKIREKYTQKTEEEDKMTRLRRLDAGVTRTAMTVSLTFGVFGLLILGFGMSLCMTELYSAFSLSEGAAMAVGISIGIFGGAIAALAYPIFTFTVKRLRKKLSPEIIRLTDELMK